MDRRLAIYLTTNTRHSTSVGLMLRQCRRQWANFKPALLKHLEFARLRLHTNESSIKKKSSFTQAYFTSQRSLTIKISLSEVDLCSFVDAFVLYKNSAFETFLSFVVTSHSIVSHNIIETFTINHE